MRRVEGAEGEADREWLAVPAEQVDATAMPTSTTAAADTAVAVGTATGHTDAEDIATTAEASGRPVMIAAGVRGSAAAVRAQVSRLQSVLRAGVEATVAVALLAMTLIGLDLGAAMDRLSAQKLRGRSMP